MLCTCITHKILHSPWTKSRNGNSCVEPVGYTQGSLMIGGQSYKGDIRRDHHVAETEHTLTYFTYSLHTPKQVYT